MVTRYDLEVYSQGAAGQCDIVPDPEGDYVLLADYNKLEERLLVVYAKENKTICPYCSGMGWVVADVGQMYECVPCKTTGFIEKDTNK